MENFANITELIEYTCAGCGSDTWTIFIGHRTDGSTFLNTICANKECVERRREQLQAPDDALIVWNEFDITGQGHDSADLPSTDAVN